MEDIIVDIKNLNKTFKSESGTVQALTDINLSVRRGEILGIIGFSGAGKSTLVRCINKLESPDSGIVEVCGENVAALKGKSFWLCAEKRE